MGAGYQETAVKEKFLVAAVQTDSAQEQFTTPETITELWKATPKDAVFEYRSVPRSLPSCILCATRHLLHRLVSTKQ